MSFRLFSTSARPAFVQDISPQSFQENRGYFYQPSSSLYYDAPEATTTKFSYVPTYYNQQKSRRPTKYKRNNSFGSHATSLTNNFDYDEYNDCDDTQVRKINLKQRRPFRLQCHSFSRLQRHPDYDHDEDGVSANLSTTKISSENIIKINNTSLMPPTNHSISFEQLNAEDNMVSS